MNMQEILEVGLKFNGHKCPAMPLGIRSGLAAMEALNVERASNKELYMVCENGPSHATMCFLDGAMAATGCTYGKANVERRDYVKNVIVLVDKKTGRAVRVAPNPDFRKKGLASEFVQLRKRGIEPKDIEAEIVDPMIENIMAASDDDLFIVSDVFEHALKLPKGTFNWHECEICWEIMFESKARIVNDQKVCAFCSGYED
jgi:formylmethanofuran dehydrogenase subunit E